MQAAEKVSLAGQLFKRCLELDHEQTLHLQNYACYVEKARLLLRAGSSAYCLLRYCKTLLRRSVCSRTVRVWRAYSDTSQRMHSLHEHRSETYAVKRAS